MEDPYGDDGESVDKVQPFELACGTFRPMTTPRAGAAPTSFRYDPRDRRNAGAEITSFRYDPRDRKNAGAEVTHFDYDPRSPQNAGARVTQFDYDPRSSASMGSARMLLPPPVVLTALQRSGPQPWMVEWLRLRASQGQPVPDKVVALLTTMASMGDTGASRLLGWAEYYASAAMRS